MGFFRQEHWNGLPFPPQGSSRPRDQTSVSCVSCIAGGFFTTEQQEFEGNPEDSE